MAAFVLGITGPLACGKDQAATFFRKLGFSVIDVDKIGHKVLQEQREAVVARFGRGVLTRDGQVGRSELGQIVFADSEALCALNKIMHPAMKDQVARYLAQIRANVVINAALLHKMGLDSFCSKVLFIDVPENIRLERTMARDKLSAEEVRLRFSRQKDINHALDSADIIVENHSTLEDFFQKLQSVSQTLLQGDNYGAAEQSEGNVYP